MRKEAAIVVGIGIAAYIIYKVLTHSFKEETEIASSKRRDFAKP